MATITTKPGDNARNIASAYTMAAEYGAAILRLNNLDARYKDTDPLPTGTRLQVPDTWFRPGAMPTSAFATMPTWVMPGIAIGIGLMLLGMSQGRGKR